MDSENSRRVTVETVTHAIYEREKHHDELLQCLKSTPDPGAGFADPSKPFTRKKPTQTRP